MDAVEEGHGGHEEYQVVPSVVQRRPHHPSRFGGKEWPDGHEENRRQPEIPKRHVLVSVDVVRTFFGRSHVWGSKSSTSRIAQVRSSMVGGIRGLLFSSAGCAKARSGKGEEFQQGKVWKGMQERCEKV